MVKALTMQMALPGVVAPNQRTDRAVRFGQHQQPPRGVGGKLGRFACSRKDQGIGGPLGGAPRFFGGVADVAGFQHPQRVGMDGAGVGEDGGYAVGG